MTILLRRYSGFPPEIFERGIVPQMRDCALRLYLFLCRTSDRKSTLQFSVTDKEVKVQTGASPRALRDARINLIALGLVSCEKALGGSYTYTLCDVDTGRPFPGDPKVKAPYTKRPKTQENRPSPAPSQPSTVSGATTIFPRSVPISLEDTSFDYGYNSHPAGQPVSAADFSPFALSHSRR
jgi:hypothetical protein